MLELVLVDGVARGSSPATMLAGDIEPHSAGAVILCSGGYSNVFYLSTNARGCNATGI